MAKETILVWLWHDLRLADQPMLKTALARGASVVPVFLRAPEEEGHWAPGAASRWWLHQSLRALTADLEQLGSRLILRRTADSLAELRSLRRDTGAAAIFWNRRYEPVVARRDSIVQAALAAEGCEVQIFDDAVLHAPENIQTKSGGPYQVFTPFWKTCARLDVPAPLVAPRQLPVPRRWPRSLTLPELELEPAVDWAAGFRASWQPGEAGARANLKRFLQTAWPDYATGRNRPDRRGTSQLSPHLHFGEISPRQVWHGLRRHVGQAGGRESDWRGSQYLAELGWREFAHHLLHHFPHTAEQPLRPEFAKFPWRGYPDGLRAWQRGQTGYPIVDAGMRELWATGWMHNRVRMVVASFLVKDLLVSWREGARWFWDTLVDADLASNTLGWQWTAGCGADAAPFFRVFNPVMQGAKFDPEGDYVRRWVPELRALPARWIHRPWEAPEPVRHAAGVQLGQTYPRPIVSRSIARDVALEAYQKTRG